MADCIAIIISICSLGFSIFVYLKHDKKIKGQSAILNELQIGKLTEEKEENKKAKIEINVVKDSSGYRIIRVQNAGKSLARNVMITFDNNEVSSSIQGNPSPVDINPQSSIQMSYFANKQTPGEVEISLGWEDDFSKENNYSQTIQL